MFSSVFVIHKNCFAIKYPPFVVTDYYYVIIPHKYKNRNPFISELRHYLNLTPCELQTLGVWHFVLCCGSVATLAEQPARASLTSELADSALLGYLRRRSLRELRCGGEKSFSATPKRKIRHTRMSMPYFWRRRKDLILARTARSVFHGRGRPPEVRSAPFPLRVPEGQK